MRRFTKFGSIGLVIALIVTVLMPALPVLAGPPWLDGWDYRVKLTIDNTDIDDTLANFPILLYISTSSGRNSDDISFVFDELTLDANRKKIAVTTSDGTTECYVEIEKWDDANEQAWLWVKVPSVASDADTDLYLYYDIDHADNDTYVGDTNSTPAENVWDDNFKLVSHMRDDPDTSHIRDSTGNNNDGTKKAANEPIITTSGQIDGAQDFDGTNDHIEVPDLPSLDIVGDGSLGFWIKAPAWQTGAIVMKGETTSALAMNYAVWGYADGIPVLIIGDGSGSHTVPVASALSVDTWYHLVGTWDGSKLRFYLNGVENNWVNQTRTPAANADKLLLGWSSLTHYSNVVLDEVRISDTGRSAAWIKASYESETDDLLDFGIEREDKVYLEFRPDLNETRIRGNEGIPSDATVGIHTGYSLPIFAANNEELYLVHCVPDRWDSESNILLHINSALANANESTHSYKLQVEWGQVTPNEEEIPAAGWTTVTATRVVDSNTQYETYRDWYILDYDIVPADVVKVNDLNAIRIRRVTAAPEDDLDGELIVMSVGILYARGDVLGDPEGWIDSLIEDETLVGGTDIMFIGIVILVLGLTVAAFFIRSGMLYAVCVPAWLFFTFYMFNATWPGENTYLPTAIAIFGTIMTIIMVAVTGMHYMGNRSSEPTYDEEKAANLRKIYKLTHTKKPWED